MPTIGESGVKKIKSDSIETPENDRDGDGDKSSEKGSGRDSMSSDEQKQKRSSERRSYVRARRNLKLKPATNKTAKINRREDNHKTDKRRTRNSDRMQHTNKSKSSSSRHVSETREILKAMGELRTGLDTKIDSWNKSTNKSLKL